jgi:putative SOS response-associated peptidase YedK
VPADAFYEWQKLDAKNKQPFAIAMKDGQPYALAGLWEKWKDRKAGTELLTFTVITTDPNSVVEPAAQQNAGDCPRTRLRPLVES